MLFDLRKKKKYNFLNSFIGGFGKPPFDPFALPSYYAGYLMNYTTDVPAGTIDPTPANRIWYSYGAPPATMRINPNANTIVTGLNGYNAIQINATVNRLTNGTLDLLDGIVDATFLIGFKRTALATATHFLLFARNSANTIRVYIRLQATGKLLCFVATGAQTAIVESVLLYDDNLPHCLVCTLNQTTKTISMVTDKGESLSNTNAALTMPTAFNTTAASQVTFGNDDSTALSLNPGVLGDILIFNSVLLAGDVSGLLDWEKMRLGI